MYQDEFYMERDDDDMDMMPMMADMSNPMNTPQIKPGDMMNQQMVNPMMMYPMQNYMMYPMQNYMMYPMYHHNMMHPMYNYMMYPMMYMQYPYMMPRNEMDNQIPEPDSPASIMMELDEETDPSDTREPVNDVNRILRNIERNNPAIFRTLMAYRIPYPVARNIVRRIIRLTLMYCKD